jgi:hypothetical protein
MNAQLPHPDPQQPKQMALALTLQEQYGAECEGCPLIFWPWVESNRHILKAFCERALYYRIELHKEHWGAKCIVEELRHKTALREHGKSPWKLNNSQVSGLARLSMAMHAELDGLFRLRNRAE